MFLSPGSITHNSARLRLLVVILNIG
ncbi:uncharacterized protein METZ01_LOCUS459587, partial [marine metagenome]